MALTITHKDDETSVTPWKIDYESYNRAEHNAFFKAQPELEHRQD